MEENEEILKLFEGVMPERKDEILQLMDSYCAQYVRTQDKVGFNIDAGAFGLVQFTQRSLKQLWLFGFAGLKALHCFSGIIFLLQTFKMKFDLNEINNINGQRDEYKQFENLIKDIKELNNIDTVENYEWPSDIPMPKNGKPKGVEENATFDLIMMASAYVFLHELKHVIFNAENNAPTNILDEELACDTFAKEMILGKISEYSQMSGYSNDQINMKRSAGIALGSAFLLLITPTHLLKGSESHPSVYSRWMNTLADINLDDNNYYWLYFASLAIGSLIEKGIPFPTQIVNSYKDLAISAIKALESRN